MSLASSDSVRARKKLLPPMGKDGGEEHATDGGKQGAPSEQPEPKHLKISDAPASVLEEGRIYFLLQVLSHW